MKCEICSVSLGYSRVGYKAHMQRFHALESQASHIIEGPKPLPINLTGRTKKQIVSDMEASALAAFIVVKTDGTHIDSCRCVDCINAKIAQLAKLSETLATVLA